MRGPVLVALSGLLILAPETASRGAVTEPAPAGAHATPDAAAIRAAYRRSLDGTDAAIAGDVAALSAWREALALTAALPRPLQARQDLTLR